MPDNYSQIAYWGSFYIVDLINLFCVLIVIGTITGYFLKMSRFKASFLALVFFVLAKLIYTVRYTGHLSLRSPVLFFIIFVISTFFVFWFCFFLGSKLRRFNLRPKEV